MKKPDIIASIIGILLGVYVLITSAQFPKDVVMQIGPNFFPNILAILLIFFSLLLLIFALLGKSKGTVEKFDFKAPETQRAGIALLATIIYCVLLNMIGFIVMTVIYLLFLMYLLKKRNYFKMSLISIAVTIGVFIIFEKFLHITLPLGIFNISF